MISDSKYFLTFDFKIIYIQNALISNGCREINLDTLKFEIYKRDENILKYSIPINPADIEYIVYGILRGKISNLISLENIDWINNFEKSTKNNSQLFYNDKLTFNYLILKLMMAGFSKNYALNIAKHYFFYKRENKPVLKFKNMIEVINEIIDNKELWITNRLSEYENIELTFLNKLFSLKTELRGNFNIESFKEEYLNICNSSFVRATYELNKKKSFIIKNPKDLKEQTDNLIVVYEFIIDKLIKQLIIENHPQLKKDRFIKHTISYLKDILFTSMAMWK